MSFGGLLGLDAPKLKLRYGRVYLRAPRGRDYRAWAALRGASREFLTPWEPTWGPEALSRAAYRQRLRFNAAEWRQDLGYAFFLFRQEDNALLGGITLRHIQRGVAQMGDIGYWMGEPHARQGYMIEGLRALTDFAFGKRGLHRIEAACLPENEASKQLLERFGFQPEGRARAFLKINGAWRDHLLYGLLSEDPRWPDR